MVSEAAVYLAKARESLDSAQADSQAGRYNSAANRAYYAAFQAAISLLIVFGVRPKTRVWDHRFVHSQLSGKLISRRKVFPAKFRATLKTLFEIRGAADYQPRHITRSEARRALSDASEFVAAVESSYQKGRM